MLKIEISENILKVHKKYCEQFKDKIPSKIYISNDYLEKVREEEKKKSNFDKLYLYDQRLDDLTTIKCQKAHEWLVQYYKDEKNHTAISIGKPKEIRYQIDKMKKEELYSIIETMIDFKIKVKVKNEKNEKNEKEYIYSNLLIDKLGYEKFSKVSLNVTDKIEDRDLNIIDFIPKDAKKEDEDMWRDYLKLLYIKLKVPINDIKGKSSKQLINYWGAYPLAFYLDIMVCPYCNRQHISPIITKNGRMRGDMDHFYSKEQYPLFSLSIYNLVPVCKFCNSSFKGTKNFELKDIHPYEDNLDDFFKFKFYVKGDNIHIATEKIIRDENNKDGFEKYNEFFKYEEQYQYHENLVKEFITKTRIYNDSVIDDIKKKFNSIGSLSNNQLKEHIYGYKMTSDDILKKTLSKFAKDILIQLNYNTDNTDDIILNIEEKETLLKIKTKL